MTNALEKLVKEAHEMYENLSCGNCDCSYIQEDLCKKKMHRYQLLRAIEDAKYILGKELQHVKLAIKNGK